MLFRVGGEGRGRRLAWWCGYGCVAVAVVVVGGGGASGDVRSCFLFVITRLLTHHLDEITEPCACSGLWLV